MGPPRDSVARPLPRHHRGELLRLEDDDPGCRDQAAGQGPLRGLCAAPVRPPDCLADALRGPWPGSEAVPIAASAVHGRDRDGLLHDP
eukprot:1349287-Heterocapsa_arctica.AAC.1